MKHLLAIVAVCSGLLVLYVLSEAPFVKLTGGIPNEGVWTVYKPVDWLIDETSMADPLYSWARLWGVEEEFALAEWYRGPQTIDYAAACCVCPP